MKKLLLIFILLFFMGYVEALEVSKIASITSRCVLTIENKAIIPIEVIAINDGMLSNKLGKLKLGKILNYDNVKYYIENLSGNNITQVIIDEKKDSSNYSIIYFSLDKDKNYELLDKVLSFNLVVEYENNLDSIEVLGNEVFLSNDENICNNLNDYEINEINKNSVKLISEEHSLSIKLLIGIIIGLIVFVIVLSTWIFWLKKR